MISHYSDEQLKACADGLDLPDFPEIPHHSQNVERAVARTTEAAKNAIGVDNIHALILKTIKSREILPTDANKSDFLKM